MIWISPGRPVKVRSLPVLFYLAGALFVALGVLPFWGGPPRDQALVGALVSLGVGLLFGGVSLYRTRTLFCEGERLLVRWPLGLRAYPVADATLGYDHDGNLQKPAYWLVLLSSDGRRIQLLHLGHGMSLQREIRRARRVAGALGLPITVPQNLEFAAETQSSGPIPVHLIPWIVLAFAVVMTLVSVVLVLLES